MGRRLTQARNIGVASQSVLLGLENPDALITGPHLIRVGLLDPGELLTRGASAYREAA
jgi:hypothetical protein